jgi:hypothetical protein
MGVKTAPSLWKRFCARVVMSSESWLLHKSRAHERPRDRTGFERAAYAVAPPPPMKTWEALLERVQAGSLTWTVNHQRRAFTFDLELAPWAYARVKLTLKE